MTFFRRHRLGIGLTVGIVVGILALAYWAGAFDPQTWLGFAQGLHDGYREGAGTTGPSDHLAALRSLLLGIYGLATFALGVIALVFVVRYHRYKARYHNDERYQLLVAQTRRHTYHFMLASNVLLYLTLVVGRFFGHRLTFLVVPWLIFTFIIVAFLSYFGFVRLDREM